MIGENNFGHEILEKSQMPPAAAGDSNAVLHPTPDEIRAAYEAMAPKDRISDNLDMQAKKFVSNVNERDALGRPTQIYVAAGVEHNISYGKDGRIDNIVEGGERRQYGDSTPPVTLLGFKRTNDGYVAFTESAGTTIPSVPYASLSVNERTGVITATRKDGVSDRWDAFTGDLGQTRNGETLWRHRNGTTSVTTESGNGTKHP